MGRFILRHDPPADKDRASALLLGYQAYQYVYQYMQAMFKSQEFTAFCHVRIAYHG